MPRNYKPRPVVHWTQKALEDAIAEHQQAGTSLRKLAEKYKVSKSSLQRHLTKKTVKTVGRKPVFSPVEEADLKECITSLANLGFGMRRSDITDLVESYVIANNVEAAKKVFKYGGKVGYPGPDWMTSFMKRNNLSMKEATKLSAARYNATKNPFIIYKYFDILDETMTKLGLHDRPDLIWNCDESGLPHEPKKCKIISGKGQKTLQVTPGCDRENTTVLAACSGSGTFLPPMVVFEGKHVQTTWRPILEKNHPNYPWIFANKSGWMDSDTFYLWFIEFEKNTRSFKEESEELENRLLIYDGHLSHITYQTIKLAREENITILKLPPHTTDLLQPLDVSVFKSLKDNWGKVLFRRLSKTRARLSKSEFLTTLPGEDVWLAAFSETNIRNGFQKCGIFPYDRSMYPENRFNSNLLKRYKVWIENGKPDLTANEIDDIYYTRLETEPEKTTDSLDVTTESVEYEGRKGKIISYFVPDDQPDNLIRIPTSSSFSQPIPSTPKSSTPNSETFASMALKRLDEQNNRASSSSTTSKRRKVNPDGGLVTSDESFAKLTEDHKKKQRKENNNKDSDEEIGVVEEMSDDDGVEEESESIIEEDTDDEVFPPRTPNEALTHLDCLWRNISPPVEEKDLVDKFFAAIYYQQTSSKKKFMKGSLFVGKVINRFLDDKEGPVNSLVLDCLDLALGSPEILQERPQHLGHGIGYFKPWNIIAGPLNATVKSSTKWLIPDYLNVVKTFNMVDKLDREKEFKKRFPN